MIIFVSSIFKNYTWKYYGDDKLKDEKPVQYSIDYNDAENASTIQWLLEDYKIKDLVPYIESIICDGGEEYEELWGDDFSVISLNEFNPKKGDDEDTFILCYSAVVEFNLNKFPKFKDALDFSSNQVEIKIGFKLPNGDDLDEEVCEGYSDIPIELKALVGGDDKEANIDGDVDNASLKATSSAQIHSDGDFIATMEIDISNLGSTNTTIFTRANITAEIGKYNENSLDTFFAEVNHGSISLSSNFISVDEGTDPNYSITAELELYKISNPNKIEITLPKETGEISLEYESQGVRISKIQCEWELEDDYCEIVVYTKGVPPYVVLLGVSNANDENFPDVYMFDDDEAISTHCHVYDVKPGDKAIIEIRIGERIHNNLSITSKGKAEVEDRTESDEVDDDFFGEEEDDSISPFVFCFTQSEIEEVADENGAEAAKNKLLSEMSMFMGAITDCVDDEARFFITNNKEKVVEVFDRGDIEKEWGLLKDQNMASWLENRNKISHIQIAVVIRGNDHWDDGFLRVSEYEGVAHFYAWGMYTPIGEIASQGYYNGDFDSGIAADPEDDSYYYGQSAMDYYALKEIQFELATYGIDEI